MDKILYILGYMVYKSRKGGKKESIVICLYTHEETLNRYTEIIIVVPQGNEGGMKLGSSYETGAGRQIFYCVPFMIFEPFEDIIPQN